MKESIEARDRREKGFRWEVDERTLAGMRSRTAMALMMLTKLPLGLAAGLRIDHIDDHVCAVSLPFGWRTQNPFRSIYFAALAMAAEMSTGALGMLAIRSSKHSVAQLVTKIEADFVKKADQRTMFLCQNGPEIFDAVATTIRTREPVKVVCESVGTTPDEQVVARFSLTWSFKARDAA